MKFPQDIQVFGDRAYRGPCPQESAEQKTAIGWIRRQYPHTLGKLVIHPRNEGKRSNRKAAYEKAEGLTPGASDIIIPGCPAFVCELKRQDHTKSRMEPEQVEYLLAAKKAGAFACIALGWEGVVEAITHWRKNNV